MKYKPSERRKNVQDDQSEKKQDAQVEQAQDAGTQADSKAQGKGQGKGKGKQKEKKEEEGRKMSVTIDRELYEMLNIYRGLLDKRLREIIQDALKTYFETNEEIKQANKRFKALPFG